eukprot:scaffold2335_cov175-Amphora_coffeaeformis.AAC.3
MTMMNQLRRSSIMKTVFLLVVVLIVAASSFVEAFATKVTSRSLQSRHDICSVAAKSSLSMSVLVDDLSTPSSSSSSPMDSVGLGGSNEDSEMLYQVDQGDIILSPGGIQSSWFDQESSSRTLLTAVVAAVSALGLYHAHDVLQMLWHAYQHSLESHPIYTKAATSATVYAFGDVLAQRTASGNDHGATLDVPRVLRSLVAGGLGHGPLSHLYYDLSEDLFGHVLHWTAWWSTIPKIIVDQTLFGPFWNNTYLLMIGLMQGHSFRKIFHEMKTTTIPLVLSGLKLWPAVHVVTYGFMPVPYRLVWVDAVEVLWVSILATEAAAASQKSLPSEAEPATSA